MVLSMSATDHQQIPFHLLAAHEELCQLIDHLPVAVVSWRNQQLHYCNDAFLRLLGLEEQVQQQAIWTPDQSRNYPSVKAIIVIATNYAEGWQLSRST